MIAGFKRFYEGDVAEEVYTQLGQTDYAAEIAQIKAADADLVYYFLPGGMGISFMKQYAGSGADKPVMGPAFSFDQGILGAIGDAALGVKNTSHWSKDLDNRPMRSSWRRSRRSMAGCRRFTRRRAMTPRFCWPRPSRRPTSSDADAFRAALEEADFQSVRGDFEFAPNHHPIQDIYMREVVKEGDVVTNQRSRRGDGRPPGRLRRPSATCDPVQPRS